RPARAGTKQVWTGDQTPARQDARPGSATDAARPRRRGDRMKRREFITLLGTAAAWPLAAPAQQPGKIARVGVLMGYAKGDPEAEGWVSGLIQGLHDLRWVEGSNIRIDYRWPSENAGNMSSYAADGGLKTRRDRGRRDACTCCHRAGDSVYSNRLRECCRSGWARLRFQFRSSRWKHYGVYL